MRNLALVPLALTLLMALALPATPARAQNAPPNVRVAQVDTSNYPQVTLYVSVADAAGVPQPGLNQRDFAITEDGEPVEISSFVGGGSTPVSALLLLDCSNGMEEDNKIGAARTAASSFVGLMRPGDQTGLLTFCHDPRMVQPFTSDVDALQRSIGRLRTDGPTPLYDGLVAGVEALEDQPGRRALLLLSDGRDCRARPCATQPGSQASLDEAVARAQASGLSVEVIGLGDPDGSLDGSGIDERVLQRIAEDTGGEYFHAPDGEQLAALYARLGGSIQQEYAITYTSPRPFYDGTRRDIQVRVGEAQVAGGYTEQHLINVQSSPFVGVLLLLPLLGLLALPTLMRRGSKRLPQINEQQVVPLEPAPVAMPVAATAVASGAGIQQPAATTQRCVSCDAELRAGARFCSHCGSTQPKQPVAASGQRTFCDQCGRPMLAAARFCMECGAEAPRHAVEVGR